LAPDLRAQRPPENLEQRRLLLVFDHVLPRGLLREMLVQQLLQVNRQEFVRVSLLPESEGLPDAWQRFDDRQRVRALALLNLVEELGVGAVEAVLLPALLGVFLGEEQRPQRHCVRQTLHHRVEKTRVSVVLHSERHARALGLDQAKLVCLRVRHFFKRTIVAALWSVWPHWLRVLTG